MFDHFGLVVRDMSKSLPFFEHALAPLGIRVIQRQPEYDAVIFSSEREYPFFFLGSGRPSWWEARHAPGAGPVHFAFPAPSRASVDEFHAQGLSHGGLDNGAPGPRGQHWYAAYLLDPDGNSVEAGIGHVFTLSGHAID